MGCGRNANHGNEYESLANAVHGHSEAERPQDVASMVSVELMRVGRWPITPPA